MSFLDCIQTAVTTGRLSQNKADEAAAAYTQAIADGKANGLTDAAAEDAAAMKAVKETTTLKAEARWRRVNELRVAHDLYERLSKSGKPHEEIIKIGKDFEIKYQRTMAQATSNLADFMLKYKPKYGGVIHPTEGLDEIIRAAFDEPASAEAKAFADALLRSANWLVDRVNMEGASIPRDAHWRFPQYHDRALVRMVSKEEWVADHLANDVLDWDIMRYEGKEIPVDKREEILGKVYDGIATDGNIRLKPGQQENAAWASRISQPRFLYYKNADAWLAMQKKYSHADPYQSIISTFESLARSSSVMETLGPNPNAMNGFLQRTALKRSAELDLAKPGARKTVQKKVQEAVNIYDDMYKIHTHNIVGAGENLMAQTVSTVRGVEMMVHLGGVFISSLVDPFMTKWARHFYGLPEAGVIRAYGKHMFSGEISDKQAAQAGIIMESALSQATVMNRVTGFVDGPYWTRRLQDIVFRSGLATRHFQRLNNANGLEMLKFFADYSGKEFSELPMMPMMESQGITGKDWDMLRQTSHYQDHGLTLLRPLDMWNNAKNDAERRVADKFQDFMYRFIHIGAPIPSLEVRAHMGGAISPATPLGQFMRSKAALQSFPATIFFNYMKPIFQAEMSGWNKAKMFARFFLYLTAGGAMVTQLKAGVKGQGLYDLSTPENALDFFGRSIINGGSLGMLGDFVMNWADINGQGSSDGIVDEAMKSLAGVTVGDLSKAIQGKPVDYQRDLYRFAKSQVPSIWETQLIFGRLVGDELMQANDPAGYNRLVQRQQEAANNGQDAWWGVGQRPFAN